MELPREVPKIYCINCKDSIDINGAYSMTFCGVFLCAECKKYDYGDICTCLNDSRAYCSLIDYQKVNIYTYSCLVCKNTVNIDNMHIHEQNKTIICYLCASGYYIYLTHKEHTKSFNKKLNDRIEYINEIQNQCDVIRVYLFGIYTEQYKKFYKKFSIHSAEVLGLTQIQIKPFAIRISL